MHTDLRTDGQTEGLTETAVLLSKDIICVVPV